MALVPQETLNQSVEILSAEHLNLAKQQAQQAVLGEPGHRGRRQWWTSIPSMLISGRELVTPQQGEIGGQDQQAAH